MRVVKGFYKALVGEIFTCSFIWIKQLSYWCSRLTCVSHCLSTRWLLQLWELQYVAEQNFVFLVSMVCQGILKAQPHWHIPSGQCSFSPWAEACLLLYFSRCQPEALGKLLCILVLPNQCPCTWDIFSTCFVCSFSEISEKLQLYTSWNWGIYSLIVLMLCHLPHTSRMLWINPSASIVANWLYAGYVFYRQQ